MPIIIEINNQNNQNNKTIKTINRDINLYVIYKINY